MSPIAADAKLSEVPLGPAVDAATRRALASGALIPFQTRGETLVEDGLPWRIEWVSSLVRKDAARARARRSAAPRNPFRPPEPALCVAELPPAHALILNKFPVRLGHVIVISREACDQESPLERGDFDALARVMTQLDGVAFFNGGAAAGASVRHRHLQLVPERAPLIESLAARTARSEAVLAFPQLAFRHAFVRLANASGDQLATAWQRCRQALRLSVDAHGRLPAHNWLATRDWLFMVPRRREHWDAAGAQVSLNALSFGGSIFVRDPALIPAVRAAGLRRLLASVAEPRAE